MQNQNDKEIVTQLSCDDINAPVTVMYSRYFTDITGMLCSAGCNREDAADIFQETILVFIDKVKTGRYRAESSIKTFLYAVARNLWKQELRSKERRDKREKIFDDRTDFIHAEADEYYFNKETRYALDALYKEIGDVCKNILKGFYYEELSMKELLKKFDYENEQVLRNRKSLCMKKVKDMLQKNNYLNSIFKNLTSYGK